MQVIHLSSRIRIAAVLLAPALALAACGKAPTAPATTAASSGQPSAFGVLNPQLAAANLTPEDFAARGWQCRPSPVPGRTVCSRPEQGFPAVPPPEDRPATYTLLAWEYGSFAGTVFLIRSDLYQGQQCESTGAPYRFLPVIGYYECLITAGS